MQLVFVITVIVALSVVVAHPPELQQPTRYDNYSVYKVHIRNPEQRHIINSLLDQTDKYNLWHMGRTEIHIMVNPAELSTFKRIVYQEGFSVELLIENVQTLIDAQRRPK